MILILLAGINMLYFQFVTFKDVTVWDRRPIPPTVRAGSRRPFDGLLGVGADLRPLHRVRVEGRWW